MNPIDVTVWSGFDDKARDVVSSAKIEECPDETMAANFDTDSKLLGLGLTWEKCDLSRRGGSW